MCAVKRIGTCVDGRANVRRESRKLKSKRQEKMPNEPDGKVALEIAAIFTHLKINSKLNNFQQRAYSQAAGNLRDEKSWENLVNQRKIDFSSGEMFSSGNVSLRKHLRASGGTFLPPSCLLGDNLCTVKSISEGN